MPVQFPDATAADQQNYLSLMMNMLSAGGGHMPNQSGGTAAPIDNGTTIPMVQAGQAVASQSSKKKKAPAGKSSKIKNNGNQSEQ